MQCLFFQASTIKVTFPRTVVVNKVVIVNLRATAQDHVRDHPCLLPEGRQRGSKEVEDHGHVPPGAKMAAAVVNKAVIVNVRATAHDHLRNHSCHPPHGRQRDSEEEEDHGHVPPDAEMAAAVVNKAVIVNVRATAHDHLRDHPCHAPHGRQKGSEEEEDQGHVPRGAEMAAAVVNKAVIVNVRTTAHDHLRDHSCHPPHGRPRDSEEEEDHGHVPPDAEMAAAVVNKAVIVNVRAAAHDHLRDHPCHPPHG